MGGRLSVFPLAGWLVLLFVLWALGRGFWWLAVSRSTGLFFFLRLFRPDRYQAMSPMVLPPGLEPTVTVTTTKHTFIAPGKSRLSIPVNP